MQNLKNIAGSLDLIFAVVDKGKDKKKSIFDPQLLILKDFNK